MLNLSFNGFIGMFSVMQKTAVKETTARVLMFCNTHFNTNYMQKKMKQKKKETS